jgi:LPS export ABC transporter permease LptG/LPS export ABC transporter permease LptF
MLRTIDRYILRETLPMVFLSLLVLTFMLMIPPLMGQAQDLLAKGVDFATVATLMGLLVPQGLGVTIPMAVLMGLLMGLGRLSGDRETVAMQACGISFARMLRPVAVLALCGTVATCYVMVVALPDANQAFREIVFRQLASYTADQVKPQVWDQSLPGVNLYVRDVTEQGTEWTDVFLAMKQDEGQPVVYVAKQGRIVVDYDAQTVDILLLSGSIHRVAPDDPGAYTKTQFTETLVPFDAESIFADGGGPPRGFAEMTLPELQEQVTQIVAGGASPHNPIMEIHQRFSIPTACIVFALIALALGVTSRKDGKLASFALGIGVIFFYYVLLYGAKALAKGAVVSPHLAMWLPNIAIGGVSIFLLVQRSRTVEGVFSFRLPFPKRRTPEAGSTQPGAPAAQTSPTLRTPSGGWSMIGLLDRYVATQYLRLVCLSFVGLLGIFYISTFVDLSDKLFKGQATFQMIGVYFWYQTPQWVYFVLPISTLVATLVTIGVLTKSSELTVMKACGISLYRTSLPMLFFSLVWSAALFGMSETFLAEANRRADERNDEIRGITRPVSDALNRKWIMSPDGAIYNYASFDANGGALNGLTVYQFAPDEWRVSERAFARHAVYENGSWQGKDAWVREFTAGGEEGFTAGGDDEGYLTSELREFAIEPPEYFAAAPPDAQRMNYQELARYITELSASGVDVVPLRVSLARKLSFPLVTLILTLIAVPFAVTTGRHGTLYGVGIGIMLAITYWVVISVFSAFGSAGMLSPGLAAWAPNILFGGSAVYLLLTVRT